MIHFYDKAFEAMEPPLKALPVGLDYEFDRAHLTLDDVPASAWVKGVEPGNLGTDGWRVRSVPLDAGLLVGGLVFDAVGRLFAFYEEEIRPNGGDIVLYRPSFLPPPPRTPRRQAGTALPEILTGARPGEADDFITVKPSLGAEFFPVSRISVSSCKEGPLIGEAQVLMGKVALWARCLFNSELATFVALEERGGWEVETSGEGHFTAFVTIEPHTCSVRVKGQALPVVSVSVWIEPGRLVEASVVFPDPTEPDAWTPALARLLLTSCGWKLREVAP